MLLDSFTFSAGGEGVLRIWTIVGQGPGVLAERRLFFSFFAVLSIMLGHAIFSFLFPCWEKA